MSQARAAAGMDRLPWLAEEPAPPPRQRSGNREAAVRAVGAALLVAGVSYWVGAHSWPKPAAPIHRAQPQKTVPLPRAAELAQPEVVLEAPPQVIPVPERDVQIPMPRIAKHARQQHAIAPPVRLAPVHRAAPPAAKAKPNVAQQPLTLWPAWQSKGATGRIVRIGAYGSRAQAKQGWRHMVRAYPAVAHLPATVVETNNSRGRHFYRFQIGTTSQAHSEVLCQRMEKIRMSCAVVGLPWRPKGVER